MVMVNSYFAIVRPVHCITSYIEYTRCCIQNDEKDCDDPNPLIRALAVRTMGCIRVDRITEYLCEPLRKCLKGLAILIN